MINTITRRYHFEAAHFLPNVHDRHRCKRLHGHNYEFEVVIRGETCPVRGWVLDFWELDELVTPLLLKLDHNLLNDIGGLDNPTAEVIAWWLFERIDDALVFRDAPQDPRPIRVDHIRVYETKDCSAIACAADRAGSSYVEQAERELANT